MKPLIKWAGGKSSEIKHIERIIPEFNRYIEPFFGGGALFFDLEPKKAIINDISKELILFYKLLKNNKSRERFKKELFRYVESWERIGVYMKHFGNDFIVLYNKYKTNRLNEDSFEKEIELLFKKKIVPFNGLFHKNFCINQEGLLKEIKDNLIAKLQRTRNNVDVNNHFSDYEIKKNIESAFRSGFYMHFRNLMNREKKRKIRLSKEKKIANYYFIREFCYGGMFRFNSSGDFNVPYGGIAYNKKDFRAKVKYLFSEKIINLLKNIKIENRDFEELLKSSRLNKKDFVFLDPPYDTEFSGYEENPFTKEDQERLAKTLINLKANFILIIKETPFILNLYQGKRGIKISKFNKEYKFNIRERNVRDVRHLIIHNLNIKQHRQASLSHY
ncbi:MAG TPA: DNA adenine methylase [Candidatus Nanoarchaeia archaeon]|nr:DNA adenine methylase [Candidatus Nanoarchaeia archaeon]